MAERTTDPALLLLAEVVARDPHQLGHNEDMCLHCFEAGPAHFDGCTWARAKAHLDSLPPGTVPDLLDGSLQHWHGRWYHQHFGAEVGHTHEDGRHDEPAHAGQ